MTEIAISPIITITLGVVVVEGAHPPTLMVPSPFGAWRPGLVTRLP